MSDDSQPPQIPEQFSFVEYIDNILKKAELDKAPVETREKIEEVILDRLSSRVIATVVSTMNEDDVKAFEVFVSRNEAIHPLEALYKVAEEMPHLYEPLKRELDIFEEDLLQDFNELEKLKKDKQEIEQNQKPETPPESQDTRQNGNSTQ